MGRNKIEIKKQESASQRKTTFKKRRPGLFKKAKELSVLSDVPVLVIVKTTTGGYEVCLEGDRSFSDVVLQYLNESNENRDKSKKESIEILRKSYKDGQEVDVRSLMNNGMRSMEEGEDSEKNQQLQKVKQEIAEIEHRLGLLQKINQLEEIESKEELEDMEKSIRDLITKNEDKKALFLEQQKSNFQNFPTNLSSNATESFSYMAPQSTAALHGLRNMIETANVSVSPPSSNPPNSHLSEETTGSDEYQQNKYEEETSIFNLCISPVHEYYSLLETENNF